ncbi:ATP-binding protein [Streptomyces sp. NPDC057702]|uniref:ATP-binding protein n=1 Tax=unclassified Streptomyces TaxID=2593676 RepID=UPI0036B84140
MINSPSRQCTVELQALPERIGQVRRIVSAQLRYWHLDQLVEPAALGVSELLTNVYLHAEPDKRCTVDLVWLLDRLTVSVRDGDAREPVSPARDPLGTHGRGLALIAAVSQSWGVRQARDGGGKTVWFALPAGPVTARPARGPAVGRALPQPPAGPTPTVTALRLDAARTAPPLERSAATPVAAG